MKFTWEARKLFVSDKIGWFREQCQKGWTQNLQCGSGLGCQWPWLRNGGAKQKENERNLWAISSTMKKRRYQCIFDSNSIKKKFPGPNKRTLSWVSKLWQLLAWKTRWWAESPAEQFLFLRHWKSHCFAPHSLSQPYKHVFIQIQQRSTTEFSN